MMMIEISSIAELADKLTQLGKPKQGFTRFFRGHPNFKFELEPSIYRNAEFIKYEHKMTKDALTECSEYFNPYENLFEKLVRMQHYGYKTRILDITTNVLVALYFSVNNNDDEENGEVLVFDIPNDEIKYHDSDTVAILSALSLRDENFDIELYRKMAHQDFLIDTNLLLSQLRKNPLNLQDNLININTKIDDDVLSYQTKDLNNGYFKAINKIFNEYPEIIQLLNDIRKDKPYFLPNIDIRDFNRVLCVKPTLNNERIKRQQGAFLIFGIESNKLTPANFLLDWQKFYNGERFIINKHAKSTICDDLKSFGISHQILFPEIDNQAKHIISRYVEI